MSGQEDCGLRRRRRSAAPPGLFFYLSSLPWGSRPRLNICRASGASFSNQRPTRDSAGDNEEKPQAVN